MKGIIPKYKTAAMLTAFALLISFTAGCGGKTDNAAPDVEKTKVSLVVWGSMDEQLSLKEMVESFKQKYGDAIYDIEVRTVADEAAADEALRDPEAAADVYSVSSGQLERLAQKNAVARYSDLTEDDKKDYYKSSLEAASYNGEVYGHPYSAETCVLIYDSSKLTEDDAASVDGILSKDTGGVKLGVDLTDSFSYSVFFLTAGYKNNGSSESNREAMKTAGEYISSLKNRGVENMSASDACDRFRSGTLSAYITKSGSADYFADALGERFAAAPLPSMTIRGEDTEAVSYAEERLFVVSANSKYPEHAERLAKWLSDKDNQLKRSRDSGLLPSRRVYSENAEIALSKTAGAVYSQLENSVAAPSESMIEKAKDAAGEFVGDLFEGKIGADDIMNKIDETIERMS